MVSCDLLDHPIQKLDSAIDSLICFLERLTQIDANEGKGILKKYSDSVIFLYEKFSQQDEQEFKYYFKRTNDYLLAFGYLVTESIKKLR